MVSLRTHTHIVKAFALLKAFKYCDGGYLIQIKWRTLSAPHLGLLSLSRYLWRVFPARLELFGTFKQTDLSDLGRPL